MDMEKNTAELKDLSTASPRELADGIVEILDAKKAQEIKLLAVEEQTILADYFILCTGTSNTQVKALAGEVEFKLEQAGVHLRRMEGYQEGSWIVMDYSSVILHIFHRETRDFYQLEKLWSDAENVDLSALNK